jgi:CheY-like chemotaxis protein
MPGEVLVVDWVDLDARLLEVPLDRAGCEVRKAKTLQDALGMIKEKVPDVLIIDPYQNDGNGEGDPGFAFIATLKADPATAEIKLAATVTQAVGTSSDARVWRCWQSGFDWVNLKPVHPGAMVDVVRRMLGIPVAR